MKTICMAIEIIDKYFEFLKTKEKGLKEREVYLIVISAIFIASKFEEINPLGIKLVKNTLGSNDYEE